VSITFDCLTRRNISSTSGLTRSLAATIQAHGGTRDVHALAAEDFSRL
jgi:hypothetical protein